MSFRLKTILGIALIEAVLLIILIWQSLSYLQDSNGEQLRQRAQSSARLFAATTKDTVLSFDLATLETFVAEILKEPDVAYVRIFGHTDLLAEGGDEDLLQQPFQPDQNFHSFFEHVFDNFTVDVFETFADIEESGIQFGRIELGLRSDRLIDLLLDARSHFISIALLEICLVALFSYVLGTFLTRHLTRLKEASGRLAEGEAGIQLDVRGRDELAQTAIAFNTMSQRLSEAQREQQQALTDAYLQAGELQKREAELRTLLGSIPDGILIVTGSGSIEAANQAAEDMFGVRKELLQRNLGDLFPGAQGFAGDVPLVLEQYAQEKWVQQLSAYRSDGQILVIEFNAAALVLDNAKRFICVLRDITVRRRIERQARRDEQLKAAVLDASLDALITIDQAGRIIEFNPQAEKIFGYRRSDVINKPMSEYIIPPSMREAHEAGIEKFLRTGEGSIVKKRIEIKAFHRDGHEFPVELTVLPIPVEEQTLFTGFVRDIRDRKQAEHELQQAREQAESANQAKSRFLATVSHEVRTPLSAIMGTLSLMQEENLNDEQQRLLHTAEESGQSLLTMINDILDFSKIEAGHMKLEPAPFDLVALVDHVCVLFAASVQAKGVVMTSCVDLAIPAMIESDANRLRQVLLNLVGNAVKFTRRGGIAIEVSIHGQTEQELGLRFAVTDTGPGIAAEAKPYLFKEFRQAETESEVALTGTGLGLAICRRLVKLMDGRIGLDSALGQGSTFWFEVPVKRCSGTAAAARFDQAVPVVLISPVKLCRNALARQLSQAGLAVIACASAAEAEENLREARGGLLIVDEPEAAESLSALTAGHDRDEVPAILCLMHNGSACQAGHPAAKRIRMMQKPVGRDALFTAIANLLELEPPAGIDTDVNSPELGTMQNNAVNSGRVLVVEDSPANQVVLATRLRRAGYQVDIAGNGLEALAAVNENTYDVVLMDVRMPQMNGIDATRQIRGLPGPVGLMPIVAMTANAAQDDKQRCLEAGMDDFLTKPVDSETLLNKIRHWLQVNHSSADPVQVRVSQVDTANAAPRESMLEDSTLKQLEADTSIEFVVDMVKIVIEETQQRLMDMQKFASEGALQALDDEAHTLKSSSETFGLNRLKALAVEIEQACQASDNDQIGTLLQRLSTVTEESLRQLSMRYHCDSP